MADIVRNAGVPLAGRDLLLLGAGGAAAGALGSLLAERPRRIAVVANMSAILRRMLSSLKPAGS